jgi:chemotaxis protein MotB
MRRQLSIAMIFLVLASGCIPKKKHLAALKADADAKAQVEEQLKTAQDDRDAEKKRADDLDKKLNDLLAQLKLTAEDMEKFKNQLNGAETTLKSTAAELEELRKQRAEAEKRLAAFKAITAKFQAMIDSGKLKVTTRGGQMIVQLPAGILFASGKADLSKDGEAAIAEVAVILKEFSDRRFLIAGHTDNERLSKSSKFNDNWELSSARAITVTRALITGGVAPKNVSAAGYAEFDPVAENDTDENKQKNRRIEIILLPNINELPGLPDEMK